MSFRLQGEICSIERFLIRTSFEMTAFM